MLGFNANSSGAEYAVVVDAVAAEQCLYSSGNGGGFKHRGHLWCCGAAVRMAQRGSHRDLGFLSDGHADTTDRTLRTLRTSCVRSLVFTPSKPRVALVTIRRRVHPKRKDSEQLGEEPCNTNKTAPPRLVAVQMSTPQPRASFRPDEGKPQYTSLAYGSRSLSELKLEDERNATFSAPPTSCAQNCFNFIKASLVPSSIDVSRVLHSKPQPKQFRRWQFITLASMFLAYVGVCKCPPPSSFEITLRRCYAFILIIVDLK